jgi:ABC-type transport system substrate-binding protein/class 3 adenylate cyclase
MAVIDGERRVVAVLMADVAGSTAIGERLGPERSKFLFDEVMRLMTSEIERFEGTVAQLLGDGLLAVFGAPLAHEDDSERAVRAGLAIQRSMDAYAKDVRDAYDVDLRARIAVNTGPVVITPSETDGVRRYNALGDTVNVTARLQALASDSEVTLGPGTAVQVRDCFQLEQLGETVLRGREQPVDRYRVIAERERDADRRRPSEPLIGRERELAIVRDSLERLSDGIGTIVSVTGEPGIGKSRLVAEAAGPLRDRLTVLEGRALSYTEGFAYWPFRELLRDWLSAGVTASEARLRLDLKTALHGVFGDDREPYPFLASMLGLQPDAEAREMLNEFSRDAVHRRTVEIVAELLCRLARERPLLVVFEDLHWADEPSLELIESLLELTESEALGLVLLYRADREHGSWRVGERARQRFPHRYCEVELRPLLEADSGLLIEELAGAAVPQTVTGLLAQRSGGNPLFLSEAVRELIERGALTRGGDGWSASDVEALEVPALVQGVIQARLDRLDPAAREVVAVAAVAGRRFGTPLLERLVDPATVPRALSQLQRLDLIVEEQRRPFPAYRFRHGVVQEAAYATITEARRRVLHGEVGRALEELIADEVQSPRMLAHLARHFSEADDPERAAVYLIRAGDEARAIYADEEAIRHYRSARRFLQRMGDDRRSRETLFKIALVHHLAFNYAEAEAAYDEAFACKVEPVVQPAASERLATAVSRPGHLAPGLEYITDSNALTAHLFSGLLQVDRDLNVMPALADNFRVSADGLTYLFQIRASARWSDGHPVTAHDFEETWKRTRGLETDTAFLLDDIDGVEALDDHTLEVTLREPRNYFLYVLAAPASYPWPRHLCEQFGDEWHRERPLVSNGPYVLGESNDERIVLRANPEFDGPRGNVAEIDARFRTDDDDLRQLWERGGLDVMATAHPLTEVEDTSELVVAPALGTTILGFHPVGQLADVRVRRAAAIAVANIAPEMESSGLAARPAIRGGLLPPAMPGHSHHMLERLSMDDARALLEDARADAPEPITELRLVAPQYLQRVAGPLEQSLAELGLELRVDWVERGTHLSPLVTDAWLVTWIADYPDPDGFFRGLISDPHESLLDDTVLSGLLESARSSRDRDERLSLYAQVDQRLVEQSLLVPIAYSRTALLSRRWVRDIWANALTPLRFDLATVER